MSGGKKQGSIVHRRASQGFLLASRRPRASGAEIEGRVELQPAFGIEHDLAKVGVEGSNPFARSSDFFYEINWMRRISGHE